MPAGLGNWEDSGRMRRRPVIKERPESESREPRNQSQGSLSRKHTSNQGSVENFESCQGLPDLPMLLVCLLHCVDAVINKYGNMCCNS